VFSHQQWAGEAERHDAVGDLADLLGGMGSGITLIELDLSDRQRLHPHGRALELATGRATRVACHALPLRSFSAIWPPPPAPVNSHAQPHEPVDMESAVLWAGPACGRTQPVIWG
jgi:hypothetical protein